MEVTQKDPNDYIEYEKELIRLGWCLSCAGEGQVLSRSEDEESESCQDCCGTGMNQSEINK